MLALAFTVHVTPPAPALPATPAATATSTVTSVVAPAIAPASSAEETLPSLPPEETPLFVGSAVILLLIAGGALRVRTGRAPPLA